MKFISKSGIKLFTLAFGVIGSLNKVRADDCQVYTTAVGDAIKYPQGNCCSSEGIKCEGNSITEIKINDISCFDSGILENVVKAMSGLKNLKTLEIDATFCDFPMSVCQLTNLKSLKIHVRKNGELPECISKLTNLEELDLNGCGFEGKIPYSLGNLKNLKVLKLGGSKFDGYIPYSFSNFEKLEEIDLSSSELTGYIPEMPNIKKCDYSFTSLCKSETTTCFDDFAKYCKKSQLKESNKHNGNPHPEDFSYFKEHRVIFSTQKTKITYIPCGMILFALIIGICYDILFRKTHRADQLLEVTTERRNKFNRVVSSNTRTMTARSYVMEQRIGMVIIAIVGICIWIFLE